MPHSNFSYEFGPYRLDLGKGVLSRDGETISLAPKVTEVLIMLVMHAGELVEKDELLKEVWPDTFVEEANLTQNIFMLRKILGDERTGPRYIETVTRRGYRFVAPVRKVAAESPDEDLGSKDVVSQPVVAVLPFVNNTGTPELEYLADGITENLINNLSRVSKLRVMSRSTMFRYKAASGDPQQVGKDLGASVVLIGKLSKRDTAIGIAVELVDSTNGWQLWGESFDSESKDILVVQETITRQLLSALKLTLSCDDVMRATARYTENGEAYQSYLEGRYHWSQYTKQGIEKAIGHFRQAIEIDPNYALAYAGIVDCYLRLATNYLPPESDLFNATNDISHQGDVGLQQRDDLDPKIKLRFEWDWKSAERELRRADELKTAYPSAHQWYAAYWCSREVLQELNAGGKAANKATEPYLKPKQLYRVALSPNEETQIFCTIAREQIEVGNYEAGCLMLRKWWLPGEWPSLDGLNLPSVGDLLFTTGSLAGCLSSTGSLQKGQKHAEALLSGAIGIFEHLGAKRRSAECKIELALSYYRQGRFELSRNTLLRVLEELTFADNDLRSVALIRLGVVERHGGQVSDSLSRLAEAFLTLRDTGPLVSGRYYHELGTTLKDLANDENGSKYFEQVTTYFRRALYEFIAVGHHRYAAVVENNLGFLLLSLGRFEDAEIHLLHAQRLFKGFADEIRSAQVEDTLARLYLATERLKLAEVTAERAVARLEASDEEALLSEALTTKGVIYCRLHRYSEARGVLEGARRIAERCGDLEGAGRALLVLVEELYNELTESELSIASALMGDLLGHTQLASTRARLSDCLRRIVSKSIKSSTNP